MNKLKEIRKEINITQKEIGIILGVSERTIQEWEGGRRKPKHPEDIEEKVEALTILTKEGIDNVINGTYSIDDIVFQKKISDVEKLSKWGSFGETFRTNWYRIPKGIKEKLCAKELAELVDAIKAAYDDGYYNKL